MALACDTTLAYASHRPQKDMGWNCGGTPSETASTPTFAWTNGTATMTFIRDGGQVFRTYFINGRGDEAMGTTWNYLDITALGRQETWEDSPQGYPQTPPYKCWNWHDNYKQGEHRRAQ